MNDPIHPAQPQRVFDIMESHPETMPKPGADYRDGQGKRTPAHGGITLRPDGKPKYATDSQTIDWWDTHTRESK
jgi:hypothetical protein